MFLKQRIWICAILLVLAQSCAYSQSNKKIVYITRTGAKYHREECRYLKYSSFEIEYAEARERGYTACSVCKPGNGSVSRKTPTQPDVSEDELEPEQPAQQQTETRSAQCSAKTKAGIRCKRSTTNASGKCWQHE